MAGAAEPSTYNGGMSKARLYRVVFQGQGEVIEIYARSLSQSGFFGFVEIGDLVFGERSGVVVDPSEEKLKAQFEDVSSFYVPMHAVLRIDVVNKQGSAKISKLEGGSKVTPFPIYTQKPSDS